MHFLTGLFDLNTLFLLVAAGSALLVYVSVIRLKKWREEKNTATINKAIAKYFHKSKLEVSVTCTKVTGTKRFTAFIESEPMQRFHLSHSIESTLRDMVHNLHGLNLGKVYWRFPAKKETQTQARGSGKARNQSMDSDERLTEGLTYYQHLPKANALETSWTTFKAASMSNQRKNRLQNNKGV